MKRVLYIVLMLAALAGCKEKEFDRDLAKIFRTWVAAYALTAEGEDYQQAVMSMERLRMRWGIYTAVNRPAIDANPAWHSAASGVDDIILAAARDFSTGRADRAHRGLAQVADQMRDSWSVPPVMDLYLQYEETLGLLAEAASDGVIDDAELEGIRRLIPEARARWSRIAKADVQPILGEDSVGYPAMLVPETEAIEALAAASSSGDRTAILNAIKSMHAPYMRALKGLGDLNGLM